MTGCYHIWSFSDPFEVQPDFGQISVSNTKILLFPKSQLNLLSFAKKLKSLSPSKVLRKSTFQPTLILPYFEVDSLGI